MGATLLNKHEIIANATDASLDCHTVGNAAMSHPVSERYLVRGRSFEGGIDRPGQDVCIRAVRDRN